MEPKEPGSESMAVGLYAAIQVYHWGKIGSTSEVAQLAHANSKRAIDENTPYAELWMGTHPNGPSLVADVNQHLADWIKERPQTLWLTPPSDKPLSDNTLPFLFKVLSIKKPLSIQAHPTKSHAAQLHNANPEVYKDSNHKPELSVAITAFEALLGFRPVKQLKQFFRTVPELTQVIGKEAIDEFLKGDETLPLLKTCFCRLMNANIQSVTTALRDLLKRLNLSDEDTRKNQLADLVERLHETYPGDVGVFSPYFFNYLQMKPGEAIFIPPNEPHAYLSGACIEVMACSDNVVRAGLTPKEKDVATLVGMLTYKCDTAESKIFKPKSEDKYSELFLPPVTDFALARISVPRGVVAYTLKARNAASILLVLEGCADYGYGCLKRGTILYIPAGKVLTMNLHEPLKMYQAFGYVF